MRERPGDLPPLGRPRRQDALRRVRPFDALRRKDDAQALLHRRLRVPEPGRRQARGHEDLVRRPRRLLVRRQAPLRRQRVDPRLRRAGADAVPVRLRAQRRRLQHRQAPPGRRREGDRQPRHPRSRGRAPLAGRAERHARIVREPLRRARHDRQRGRVGRQRERPPVQERPQGGLLGPGPRPLPPHDDGPQRGFLVLPDRLPLLLRPAERRRRRADGPEGAAPAARRAPSAGGSVGAGQRRPGSSGARRRSSAPAARRPERRRLGPVLAAVRSRLAASRLRLSSSPPSAPASGGDGSGAGGSRVSRGSPYSSCIFFARCSRSSSSW